MTYLLQQEAIKALAKIVQRAEKDFTPQDDVEQLIEKEKNESWKHGRKTILVMPLRTVQRGRQSQQIISVKIISSNYFNTHLRYSIHQLPLYVILNLLDGQITIQLH